jgi:hypothetical protein
MPQLIFAPSTTMLAYAAALPLPSVVLRACAGSACSSCAEQPTALHQCRNHNCTHVMANHAAPRVLPSVLLHICAGSTWRQLMC